MEKRSVPFLLMLKDSEQVMGTCVFSNIVRGVFHACFLGYAIDHRFEGKGYMAEAVQAGIQYMFEVEGLHRIMANYIPSNTRSELLLLRMGFEKEGFARDYLMINGQWEDHVLTSLINDATVEEIN